MGFNDYTDTPAVAVDSTANATIADVVGNKSDKSFSDGADSADVKLYTHKYPNVT